MWRRLFIFNSDSLEGVVHYFLFYGFLCTFAVIIKTLCSKWRNRGFSILTSLY